MDIGPSLYKYRKFCNAEISLLFFANAWQNKMKMTREMIGNIETLENINTSAFECL